MRILWTRSGIWEKFSHQSGKKRPAKKHENQIFGENDKVCLTNFGITAKLKVS
jgi:hypothetical protein